MSATMKRGMNLVILAAIAVVMLFGSFGIIEESDGWLDGCDANYEAVK